MVAALLVYFFLYETMSLSLENVDQMYSQPNLKAWTSAKWMPPGYITRKQRDESKFNQMDADNGANGAKAAEKPSADIPTESRHEAV